MGLNITEKILAKASGKNNLFVDEIVWVEVDVLLTHDICGPGTISIFKNKFGKNAKVLDRNRIVIIPDHYIFTKNEKAHLNINKLKEFAQEQNLPFFYEPHTPEYMGVCHVTFPEKGHVRPGEIILGTDSHTCTHGAFGAFATGVGNTDAAFAMKTGKIWLKVPPSIKIVLEGQVPANIMAKDIILHIIGDIGVNGANYCTMEFTGSTINSLSIDERMTLCNMVVEAGAKNGIIHPDKKIVSYINERTNHAYEIFESDKDAKYQQIITYDVSKLEPCVAAPHSPDNKLVISDAGTIKVDTVYIGSCTGGKIADYEAAAKILDNNTVKIKTFVVPATTFIVDQLYSKTYRGKNLMQIFKDAGCLIGPPSCGACLGGPKDTFGRITGKEVVVSTTNRNFPGRMGSKDALIYLASPYTAAATAVTGKITDPKVFL